MMKNYIEALRDRKWTVTYLVICTLWCAFMSYFTLYQYDDLYYIDVFRSDICNRNSQFNLNSYLDFFSNHYQTWNGRFGDKLCPLLLGLIPRWLFAGMVGISFGILLLSAKRMVFPKVRHGQTGFILLMSAFVLLLPWLRFMFFGAHSINYVVGSAIGMVVIALFTSDIKCNILGGIALLLLAALAGAWHEEFTFICAPSLLVWLAVFKGKFTRTRVLILIGGIIGGLFIVNSGGFWCRINRESHILFYINPEMIFNILCYANVSLLTPLVAIVILAIRKLRRYYTRRQLANIMMCGTAVLLNIYLSSTLHVEPRYWWFADVFGIIGLAVALYPLGKLHINRYLTIGSLLVVAVFTIAHMVASVMWQHKLCVQRELIEREYSASKDGVVYCDRLSPKDAPWLALGRGFGMQMRYLMRTHRLENLCRNDGLILNVLPSEMKNFKPEEAIPVESSRPVSLYKWKGILLSTDTAYFRDREHYETCIHSNGQRLRYKMEFNTFKDSNGKVWVQIEPHPVEKPEGTEVVKIYRIIKH